MISQLDLGDIQGNIVKAYGRFGFPVARHVFYNISSAEVGRQFVTDITPLVTTSYPWTDAVDDPARRHEHRLHLRGTASPRRA